MKNKKVVILIIAIILIILGGGYYYVSSNKKPSDSAVTVEPEPTEEPIISLSADDIGLTLTSVSDNRKVIMEVANVGDISSLDYELSYMSKGSIPRGAIGHIEIKSKTKPVRQEIVLGTCSDVCHYDQEVSDIKLVVKVTKLDNKVYSVEKTL